ncbi:hypothetical protein [Aestuariivirga litoralis]|uniref:hypothetical protein n=1 Tax=Aestuariivirga litoralis TaxID=2650924 RepID=UPI0018C76F51|nr:hypothetical protein [Aestuariivirga litoralis]MBG1233724.1 hypothetical protein [Aestuariivirga litoralis]
MAKTIKPPTRKPSRPRKVSAPRQFKTGTLLVAASGWLVSVFLGLLDLPAKINSFWEEAPKATERVSDLMLLDHNYSGIWTSSVEGWVDATDDELKASTTLGGPIFLRLKVYNGRVDGEIKSEGLAKTYIYSVLQIEGEKTNGGIDLVAYDYILGKKTGLAKLRLTWGDQKGPLPLHLETIGQGGTFFPDKADLYRTNTDVSGTLDGELNVDLIQKAVEAGQQQRETARNERR